MIAYLSEAVFYNGHMSIRYRFAISDPNDDSGPI